MRIFVVLARASIFAVLAIFVAAPDSKGQKEQQDYATVVIGGNPTDEERGYSKEFEKLYPYREKVKLSEIRKDIKGLGIGLGGIVDTIDIPGADPITADSFLHTFSCQSDAIVIGYPTKKAAHLSEDETFVYTEYEFRVTELLKDNSYNPITINDDIRLARPGGNIKLENRLIHVEDPAFKPLLLRKTFLLFLTFVPSAKGYIAAGNGGDFQLENNLFKKFSAGITPKEITVGGTSSDLLEKVNNAIQLDCR